MSSQDERADAWRSRREAAVAAAGAIVAEFREDLRQTFHDAPLLEAVWLDRLAGRIADLVLRRKLYAWHPDTAGDPAFFVVADGVPAAEAAVAAEIRRRALDHSAGSASSAWPDGYRLTVVEPGQVVTSSTD